MAVSKLWTVNTDLGGTIKCVENEKKTKATYADEQYQALSDVINYAANGDKTERQLYVDGINCNPMIARDQFLIVKKRFGKEDVVKAYHGVISFKENEVTPDECHKIGMEFVEKVWGERFQAVVTTHLNTENLHCHFVINSVSFIDGIKMHDEEKAWIHFSKIADEICKSHGISIVENPERNRSPYYLIKENEKMVNTLYNNVRRDIDKADSISRNMMEFRNILDDMGYTYNISNSRKYWTITPKGSKKPEHVFRLFVRFAITKGIITYGMDIMLSVFEILQGVTNTIMNTT